MYIMCVIRCQSHEPLHQAKLIMESALSLKQLHTLDACNPVMRVGISKSGHQQVFYVTTCSFNRSLTSRMTGIAMNHSPKVFNFRDDVGCKLSVVVVLKYCRSTKNVKDIHELCCNFCRTFAFDWAQNRELREMVLIHLPRSV